MVANVHVEHRSKLQNRKAGGNTVRIQTFIHFPSRRDIDLPDILQQSTQLVTR